MDAVKRYKNKKLLFRENFVQILQETLPNKQLVRKMLHLQSKKDIKEMENYQLISISHIASKETISSLHLILIDRVIIADFESQFSLL